MIDVLSIEYLVRAKKNQLDEDWSMIRRLVEGSYFSADGQPASGMVEFWLRELRSADLLIQVAAEHPIIAARFAAVRPAVAAAIRRDSEETARLLVDEEMAEREQDRVYWEPLRRELEDLRRQQRLPHQN